MAVNYVTIKGYIKDGQLIYDLPDNVTDGEVRLEVPVEGVDTPISPEELAEYLDFKGLTAGEILQSGLVGSGADWVDAGDFENMME